MIDAIKERADLIQEELWTLAKKHYGLARTAETVKRIEQTWENYINGELAKRGLNTALPLSQEIEEVEKGLALAFMATCSVKHADNSKEALEMLVDAAQVVGALDGFGLFWSALNEADSWPSPAAALAKLRHAENYALAAYAKKYWSENIPADLSAQKAADKLITVVPLSHKKLAEIVSTEKKRGSVERTPEPERKT